MATIFTHPVIPLAMALGLGSGSVSRRLLVAGVVLSLLQDLDVLSIRLGLPFSAEFAHGPIYHSLIFAFGVAIIGTFFYRWFDATFHHTFWFLFAVMISHPLLDAFTHSGLGAPLFWPWSEYRYHSPLTLSELATITPPLLSTQPEMAVVWAEAKWIWLPAFLLASCLAATRHFSDRLDAIKFR